ncbi:hypothetical protein FALCPG4_004003 [Fusarium falciforme]
MKIFTPPVDAADNTNSVSNAGDSDVAFEGDSSMTAAAIFASEFVESAVGRRPTCSSNSPVKAALSSLKQMTEMENCQSSEVLLPHRKATLKGGLRGLAMPPVQTVLSMLREMKGLRYLFQEKVFAAVDPNSAEEHRTYYRLCRDNLETALASLNFLLPPNPENIEALLLGCVYAIEASKPLLAWQLVSGAAGMCQTLGWHRLDLKSDSATDRKTSLFWFTYLLDKGLALRLGRAAIMQDSEITLPKRLDKVSVPKGWQDLLGQWIRHSEIAGEAYQKLYSPAALRQSTQERSERASKLVAGLEHIMDGSLVPLRQSYLMETGPEHFGFVPDSFVTMLLKADEVWYWTTRTLIHRAVPPTEGGYESFSVVCLQSARKAFGAHRECMQTTELSSNMKATYLLWYHISNPSF